MYPASLSFSTLLRATRHPAFLLACALLPMTAAQARDVVYVIAPGDTVWNIARQHLKPGKIQALLAHNDIAAPHRLAPGTHLRIPATWLNRGNRPTQVIELAGTVSLVKADGSELPVQAGALIKAPAQLRTGAQSGATLHLPDGSRMLVGEESQIQVRKSRYRPLSEERDVLIDVPAGKVENDVARHKESPGRFEIRTPSGVAAVRGTRFRISSRPGITHAEVLEGKIGVADRRGTRTSLPAGYGLAIEGGRSTPGLELLKAPQIEEIRLLAEHLPVDLPLPAVTGAVAYRTLVAKPGLLSASLADQRTDVPVIRIVDIADGDYQVRVRAIDRHGLEGEEAIRPLTVNARPPAPFTLAPKPDAAVADTRPNFAWSRQEAASGYYFQLAASADFSVLLADASSLKEPAFQPADPLPEGSYFWRVAALSASEGRGPFSGIEQFRRVPAAPAGVDLAGTPGTVRWSKQSDARYHVQLSANPELSPTLVDRVIDEPQLGIDDLPAGTYYLRLQTQGRSGLNSGWSEVQKFNVESRFNWRYLLLTVPLLLLL